MRKFFNSTALLLILAAVFSGLTGCSDSDTSQKGSDGVQPANAGAAKKPSEYPPLASSVAQSDIKNLDGTTFKVADKKGKVVLLNLWATWCGPCRSEMPALVRMQNAHRDQGFEVIGLNTDDETVEDIGSFNDELKLNYALVWADDKLQSDLMKISKFPGIPQSFLVDRDGNLRGVFKGANPADIRKMEELVAKVVQGEDTALEQPAAADSTVEKAAQQPAASDGEVPMKGRSN
ncbi:MAG: TlpA family protein disulfide reductase [Saprospiraceae bacterium]|nr:TlpA family protein disulfide reductase [Pyrinomonadaceae bacterium]